MSKKENSSTTSKFSQISFPRQIDYCKQFNEFLKIGATGTLEELACKFEIDISLAQDILIYMIEKLKCPISYNYQYKTYFYDGNGELLIGFIPGD